MAHATDFQSRITPALNMRAQVVLQLRKAFKENPKFSEREMREYCELVYTRMGMTHLLYSNERHQFLKELK